MIGLTTVPTARRGPGIKAVISSAVAAKAAAAQVVAIKAAPSAEIISALMAARAATAGTATDPTEATQLVIAPTGVARPVVALTGAARPVIAQPAEPIAVRRARVTAQIAARSATVIPPRPVDRPTAVLDATMGVQIAAVSRIGHRAGVTAADAPISVPVAPEVKTVRTVSVVQIRVSVVTIRGKITLVVTIRAVAGLAVMTPAVVGLVVTIPVAVASDAMTPAVAGLAVTILAVVDLVVTIPVAVASDAMTPAVVDLAVMTPVAVVSDEMTRVRSAAITGPTAHTAIVVATETVVMTVVPIAVARTTASSADVPMTAGQTLGVTTDVAPMIVAPATTGALGMRRRVRAPRRRRFRTNSIPKCSTVPF